MNIPCPIKVDCPGTDFPITNYSSEGAELGPTYFSLVFPPFNPPPPTIDGPFTRPGCLSLCESQVSQEEADLCALRQLLECLIDDHPLSFSAEAWCTSQCVDGTFFNRRVSAGTFVADTQEMADTLARNYACEKAPLEQSCLSNIPVCLCLGVLYAVTITLAGGTPVSIAVVGGALPPGITLVGAVLSGTPTVGGNYSFTVRAYLANGSYAEKTYTLRVFQILPSITALPDYTIGVPYSYQLTAVGGSGNYSWSLQTGTLPAGLALDPTGLIHGTPT